MDTRGKKAKELKLKVNSAAAAADKSRKNMANTAIDKETEGGKQSTKKPRTSKIGDSPNRPAADSVQKRRTAAKAEGKDYDESPSSKRAKTTKKTTRRVLNRNATVAVVREEWDRVNGDSQMLVDLVVDRLLVHKVPLEKGLVHLRDVLAPILKEVISFLGTYPGVDSFKHLCKLVASQGCSIAKEIIPGCSFDKASMLPANFAAAACKHRDQRSTLSHYQNDGLLARYLGPRMWKIRHAAKVDGGLECICDAHNILVPVKINKGKSEWAFELLDSDMELLGYSPTDAEKKREHASMLVFGQFMGLILRASKEWCTSEAMRSALSGHDSKKGLSFA